MLRQSQEQKLWHMMTGISDGLQHPECCAQEHLKRADIIKVSAQGIIMYEASPAHSS
jgi:hypothetical protein